MEIKKRAIRTNKKHQCVMLDFVEAHPEMVNNSFTQPQARQKYLDLWKELTCILNAMGMGEKTPTQWQRVLSDWITKTKSKLHNLNMDMKSTGGGPSSGNDLSEKEIRLMNLKGWACVVGDNATTEAGFGQLSKEITEEPAEERENTSIEPIVTTTPTTRGRNEERENTSIEPIVTTTPTTRGRKYTEPNTQHTSPPHTQSAALQSPRQKLDMETMHYQTITVLKELNQNLKEMNNSIQGIKDALNEQVTVFKIIRDIVAHKEN